MLLPFLIVEIHISLKSYTGRFPLCLVILSLAVYSLWHKVKVVCCLSPFLHAELITFQCIQGADTDPADRWLAITRQEGGKAASKVCLQLVDKIITYCFIKWNNIIWVQIYFGSLEEENIKFDSEEGNKRKTKNEKGGVSKKLCHCVKKSLLPFLVYVIDFFKITEDFIFLQHY